MSHQRISRYISALISLCFPLLLFAQTQNETPAQRPVRGVQYTPAIDSLAAAIKEEPLKLFQGFSVSGDLLGLIMYGAANYGQIEGALRLNLKGTFFPILEVGLGHSDHKDEETDLHYKTNSPYFRIGCDYNFARDKRSGNRLYAGLRYAYTSTKFDLTGPDKVDPIWQTTTPYNFKGLSANSSWTELVFGIEAKVYKNFHVGWSLRYRMRLKQKKSAIGEPWYLPGFGKNDTHNLGGTFNLIFNL